MPYMDETLFVHMTNTGGTSVCKAMGMDLSKKDDDSMYDPYKKIQHWDMARIHDYGIEYKQAFTIVRDPVDRIKSSWFLKYHVWVNLSKQLKVHPMTFFVNKARMHTQTHAYHSSFASASFMLKGIEDSIRILSFYHLQSDWEKMIDDWGLPWDRKLTHARKSKSRGREKLSYGLKQELADIYKNDYKMYQKMGLSFA